MPGKEVHVFCAAYRADEMDELLRYADHIVFNSPAQLQNLVPRPRRRAKVWDFASIPSARPRTATRFTTLRPRQPFGHDPRPVGRGSGRKFCLPGLLDGLHFHTLCEQDADALAVTLDAVAEKFGDLLPKIKWLNFGGGHHITRPGYDMATLEKCIRRARNDWGVTVYLEPGEACA